MGTTRREFIRGGGSLVVYFSLPITAFAQYTSPNPGQTERPRGNEFVDTWVRIEAGGQVFISAGKVEFGQGIRTALAQIAAEELDIDLSRVRMVDVDTAHSPDQSYTFSAISIQQGGSAVRNACAQARLILLQKAAGQLSVSVSGLSASDGSILNNGQSTGVDYWSLLEGKAFDAVVPKEVSVKPRANYRLVGKPVKRLDIPGKVFAQPSFLCDMRLPGMVHARLVRAPRSGRVLHSVNIDGVTGMPGVLKVVRDGSFLAVVAERETQAAKAARVLGKTCTWKEGASLPDSGKLAAWLKSASTKDYPVASRSTDVEVNISKSLSSEYSRPFLAHASIAPSSAIAQWDEKVLTIWSHGQGMYPLRGSVAHVLGLDEEQVRCVHAESGGVYGHNGADDAACDAAVIAMQVPGRPVKLQWTRGDEFRGEPYGSAMTVSTHAALDQNGRIAKWQQDIWSGTHTIRPGGPAGAGNFLYAQEKHDPLPLPPLRSLEQPSGGADRNSVPLYDIPEMEVLKHLVPEMPIRVSALRSLGAYANIFAIESFMDELASSIDADPFEFRLAHLSDERARYLLEKLRDQSGWLSKPESGKGEGWGLGFAKYKNLAAYMGIVIKLTIDQNSGEIQLRHAQAIVDAGLVVNPDGVRAQIEGGIVQSASWTLKEQVKYDQAGIMSTDWSSYPILKFTEAPDVEVQIVERPDEPWLGVAEAAQGPTAAAIANALFHATGIRVRNTPITAAKVQSMARTAV